MKLRLQHKIQLSVGLIIIAVLVTNTFLDVQVTKKRYLESTELYSCALAEGIKQDMLRLYQVTDNIEWIQQLQLIRCIQLYKRHKMQGVVHFSVLNSQGNIMAHNRKELKGQDISSRLRPYLEKQTTIRAGASYHTLVPVLTQKNIYLGTIDIGVSADIVDSHIKQLLINSTQLFFLLQAIASLSVYFLVNRLIIQPLKDLTQSTVIISEGELDREISSNRSDEIGTLARSFSHMRDSIKETISNLNQQVQERNLAEDKIRRLNEELETRVTLRTNELSLVNQKLVLAKDKAETANQAKSEFLANMSHEIRTPMNAVLGFTDILKGVERDRKKLHYIENIQTSGQSLLNLINDILDLSKIESGKLDLQYEATSLQTLCKEMQTIFERKAIDKGLDFIVNVHESIPPSLILDKSKIRQVLINLLGNALKFSESGHIRLTAKGRENQSKQGSRFDLVFTVEDTGMGIPKDQQERIFKAFEQSKDQKASKFGGTGLGLAITNRLVAMMEGIISVESEQDLGATFIITLPDIEIAAVETLTDTGAEQRNFETITFLPATILIVDDIDYNREMLATYLEGRGFTLLFAENGREAIEQSQTHSPDLVLLDMKMPEMDGYEAAKRFNIDPELKDIPLIAVTASALKQDEDVIAEFCDGYLRKPVSKPTLILELMNYLEWVTDDERETAEDK